MQRAEGPGWRSQALFLGVCALLFAASVWGTIAWSASMATMDDMPMPGGWTMSMAWMRMPGQSWLGAAASFLGMWTVMMAAMMLPSLVPMLLRFRKAVGAADGTRLATLTLLASVGYAFVWVMLGVVVYPLGAAVATLTMQAPALAQAVPLATGLVVLIAGALQFTPWKARRLACCRHSLAGHVQAPSAVAAVRQGVVLGLHCACCCAGPMTVLLAVGVMDLRAMALVTAAITIERLAPVRERVARSLGVGVVGVGLFLVARGIGIALMLPA